MQLAAAALALCATLSAGQTSAATRRDAGAVPPPAAPPDAASTAPDGEPPDPDPFGFGTYRGQRPQFMDVAVVNGARMAISHLLSRDPPDVVYDWYKTELQKQGVGLIVGMPQPGIRYVSFRPPGSKKLKTLTILPHGRGTLILVSVGDPSPLFKPTGDRLDLPMPPGAGPMVSSTLGEAGPNRRHATFEVTGLAPSSVRRFYEDALPRRGYQREPFTGEDEGGLLMFTRGSEQLSLTAVPAETPNSSRVTLLWIRETP